MDVKKVVTEAGRLLSRERMSAFFAEYKSEILTGAAALLLSPCELTLGVRPFGIALAAGARGLRPSAIAAAVSMVTGALLWGGDGLSVGYILAAAAVFALRYVIGLAGAKSEEGREAAGLRKRLAPLLPRAPFKEVPALSAAISASVMAVIYIGKMADEFSYTAMFAGIFAVTLTPLLAYSYAGLYGGAIPVSHAFFRGRTVMLFSVTVALASAEIFAIGLGPILAFSAALYVSRYHGTAEGAVTGLVCGFALSPLYAPVYAIAALTSGLLWRVSAQAAVGVAGICSLTWAIYAGGFPALSAVLAELSVATAINIPLAGAKLFAPREEAAKDTGDGTAALIREAGAAERMRALTESIAQAATLFESAAAAMRRPSIAEARNICETACLKYCRECEYRRVCREDEYSVYSAMTRAMTDQLASKGRVSASAVPVRIADRCVYADGMIEKMNADTARLSAAMSAGDKSGIFAANFGGIAELLRNSAARQAEDFLPDDGASEELKRKLSEADFRAASVSVYGGRRRRVIVDGIDIAKNRMDGDETRALFEGFMGIPLTAPEYSIRGERVSLAMEAAMRLGAESVRLSAAGDDREENGDSVTGFLSREGYYYAIISDGMGSGREAALTSRISAAFLERMLTAGCGLRDALVMLNDFIRSGASECSATVDIMEVDLYTGAARFVKSGAAPGFILRGGKIFRLQSKTVPIGILRAVDAEMITFDIEAGDTVVMVSDGVTESFEDSPWLLDMLSDADRWKAGLRPMAEAIIREARSRSGRRDDVTVEIVKVIDNREE